MTAKICINNSRQSSDMLSMQSDQCTRPAGVMAVVVSGNKCNLYRKYRMFTKQCNFVWCGWTEGSVDLIEKTIY